MKKLLLKLICMVISVSVCLSLVACGTTEGRGSYGTIEEEFAIRYDATDSSKPLMLADNGVTKYKIVYPATSETAELLSVDELIYFFRESFGINFQAIPDDKASLDINNYYISVGDTSILRSLDDTDNEVPRDFNTLKEKGFTIANRGNTLFITGNQSNGTLCGVYEFLTKQINYDCIAYDELLFDVCDSKALYDFDTYMYTPNAQFVHFSGSPRYQYDSIWSHRMNLSQHSGMGGAGANGGLLGIYSHTIGQDVAPRNGYPQFYPDGTHFCLRNNGKDPDDPTGGYYRIAEDVCNMVYSHDYSIFYELGMNDDVGKCKCEFCTPYYREHVDSEAYLDLLNYVGKRIREFSKEKGIKRKAYAMGLMYNLFETPPTTYDEATGEYIPLNENVYVDENVMARWAPISSCFSHHWNDPNCKLNSNTFGHKINGWASLTDNLGIWTYGKYFHGAGPKMYFPDLSAVQGIADYLEEHNFLLFFTQNEGIDDDNTFYELKDYIKGKMFYNNEYDINVLFEKFFTTFYKDAAPAMKEYYNLIIANFNEISLKKNYGNCIDCWYNQFIYHEVTDWTYEVLMNLEKPINKAYELIENSNQSEEMKAKLRDRVATDAMMYQHFLYADFKTYFGTEELNSRIAKYKADCEKYGIRNLANV